MFKFLRNIGILLLLSCSWVQAQDMSNWYFTAGDMSGRVFSTKTGTWPLNTDTTYQNWLALDPGNIPTARTARTEVEAFMNALNSGLARNDYTSFTFSDSDHALANPLSGSYSVDSTGGNGVLLLPPAGAYASWPMGRPLRICSFEAVTGVVTVKSYSGATTIVALNQGSLCASIFFTAVGDALGSPSQGAPVAYLDYLAQGASYSRIPVDHGGTAATTLTNHGVLVGHGIAAVSGMTALTDGQLVVGQNGADPLGKTVTGNASLAASGALTTTKTAPWYGGYVSGRYYVGAPLAGSAAVALAANVAYFFPFAIGETRTFDRMAFEVTTAGTAANARTAIYNNNNGQPTSLVLDAGSFAVSGTGLKTVTISQSLAVGTYFLAVVFDGTETVQGANSAAASQMAIMGTTSSLVTPDPQLSGTLTFGAFPATAFSGGMGAATYAAANSPYVALRAQ